jgi:hypothetical protein
MRRQIRDDLGSEKNCKGKNDHKKSIKKCYIIYIKLFRIREEF